MVISVYENIAPNNTLKLLLDWNAHVFRQILFIILNLARRYPYTLLVSAQHVPCYGSYTHSILAYST